MRIGWLEAGWCCSERYAEEPHTVSQSAEDTLRIHCTLTLPIGTARGGMMLRVRLAAFAGRMILRATFHCHASLSIAVTSIVSSEDMLRPRRYYDLTNILLRLLERSLCRVYNVLRFVTSGPNGPDDV